MAESLRITRLEAQDFRRLRFIDITNRHRGLLLLKGPNGAGKTSILLIIIAALQGKRAAPTIAIREGAQHAMVALTLSSRFADRYKVTVKWRKQKHGAECQTLTITDLSTDPPTLISKPQSFLHPLIGDLSFDPLRFARETDRTKRTKMLRAAAGIEEAWTCATNAIDQIYTRRTQINADQRSIVTALANLPAPTERTPQQPIDVQDVSRCLQDAIRSNADHAKVKQDHANALGQAGRLRKNLEELTYDLAGADACVVTLAAQLETSTEIDTTPFTAAIESAVKINAAVAVATQRTTLATRLDTVNALSNRLETEIAEARTARQALIVDSHLGQRISGLSVDPDGDIAIDGIPLDGCSGTQRLTLSAQIAMLANPTLRVMTIDEGDVLDPDSLKALHALATEHDYDILMSVTWASAPEGATTIHIDDGAVATPDTTDPGPLWNTADLHRTPSVPAPADANPFSTNIAPPEIQL